MDDRRKAARQLMGLFCICDLEVLCKELIVELCEMTESVDPSVLAEWLSNISIAVDETSERFLEATQGLIDVLTIFDPVLAQAVSGLEPHKFSFLLIAANGFQPQLENGAQAVKYTSPGPREDELDLAKTYQWYADHTPLDYSAPIEWPNDVLMNFVDESDLRGGPTKP